MLIFKFAKQRPYFFLLHQTNECQICKKLVFGVNATGSFFDKMKRTFLNLYLNCGNRAVYELTIWIFGECWHLMYPIRSENEMLEDQCNCAFPFSFSLFTKKHSSIIHDFFYLQYVSNCCPFYILPSHK